MSGDLVVTSDVPNALITLADGYPVASEINSWSYWGIITNRTTGVANRVQVTTDKLRFAYGTLSRGTYTVLAVYFTQ